MEAKVLWTVVVVLTALWLVLLLARVDFLHILLVAMVACVAGGAAVVASGAESH